MVKAESDGSTLDAPVHGASRARFYAGERLCEVEVGDFERLKMVVQTDRAVHVEFFVVVPPDSSTKATGLRAASVDSAAIVYEQRAGRLYERVAHCVEGVLSYRL
jgi:hypothetical protein